MSVVQLAVWPPSVRGHRISLHVRQGCVCLFVQDDFAIAQSTGHALQIQGLTFLPYARKPL